MQSLDDEALGFLGRAHDVREGLSALAVAQDNFARVSFDLIYARPHQTMEAWSAELNRALSFGTEHLSLYQLTIEPGTRFATLAAQGEIDLVDPEHGATLYELTHDITQAAGLSAYEISNHARPGAESIHNLTYWRYGDYSGVGPGAHGRRGGLATARHKKPENWLKSVARNGHGCQVEEPLTPVDKASEALIMGLRLREGVDLADLAARCDLDPEALINMPKAHLLQQHGLVHLTGYRLSVTPKGRILLDRILAELVET